MNIKIEDVVPFGNVVRALFLANYDNVIGIDVDFTNPWVTATFDVQKQAVEDMVGTAGKVKLKKGEIEKRDAFMDAELSLSIKMDYAIGKCVADGSIGDTKASFNLAALNRSIDFRNIGLFHTNFNVTMDMINKGGNAAALDAKGFTTAMVDQFKKNYDNAWKMNNSKIDLSQDINTLSGVDKTLVDTFMATCMLVLAPIRTYARSVKNKDLAKRATFAGIKRSVEPKEVKKAKKLNIKEFASRVVATKVPTKHKLQFTLMNKGMIVMVCRQDLKTGVCSVGTQLVAGEMLEVVIGDILGTGDYVVITNMSGKKVVVKFLKIAVA
jgi:hypothetical protein